MKEEKNEIIHVEIGEMEEKSNEKKSINME